jgi:hypothetical protein
MIENHPPRRFGSGRDKSGRPFPDDRQRVARARQAAEALFAPKPPVTDKLAVDRDLPADQLAREPRVLGTSSPAAVRPEVVEVLDSHEQPRTRDIPAAQFALVRTWVKYGMTVPQVAQVFGVAVEEIERILRKD